MVVNAKKKRLPRKKRVQPLHNRVSRPPKALARVLEAIDQIPPDLEIDNLPPLGEIDARRTTISKAVGWPENPWIEKTAIVEGREVRASTLNVPERAFWIMGSGNPFGRYQLALRSKNLRQIARGDWLGRIEVIYEVTDNGEWQLTRDELIDGLNACGKKHDLRHLRVCAVESCKRLFWAKRLSEQDLRNPHAKVGHDERCKNILRVRKSRGKIPKARIVRIVENELAVLSKYSGKPDYQHTDEDLSGIAENFDISVEDVKSVVAYLKENAKPKKKRVDPARKRR